MLNSYVVGVQSLLVNDPKINTRAWHSQSGYIRVSLFSPWHKIKHYIKLKSLNIEVDEAHRYHEHICTSSHH